MTAKARKFVKLTQLDGHAAYIDTSKISAVYEKHVPSGYGNSSKSLTVVILDNGTTAELQGSVSVNIKLIAGE